MSARDEAARERQCRLHLARWRVQGDTAVRQAFEAGWNTAHEAPPLPWLYRTFAPMIATAHRAGRRAARAHMRAQARSTADAHD